MNIIIRQEQPSDHKIVFNLIKSAFENEVYTDHKEQYLVERLRKSDVFIPELSLVAERNGEIVGYILLTKLKIKDDNFEYDSLALAPVAVLPEYHNQGIGGLLINKAHEISRNLGHTSVILLGHAGYYPKFGYKLTKDFAIKLPFDVPDENCMAIELTPDALKNVKGMVEYPSAFYE